MFVIQWFVFVISRRQIRDGLKSHLFADAYFWSSENLRCKSVMYLLTYLHIGSIVSVILSLFSMFYVIFISTTVCWIRIYISALFLSPVISHGSVV